MTPEAQRIAIAEACGWLSATNDPSWWWDGNEQHDCCQEADLPDYLNDLNAMHEAEKVLSGKQQQLYGAILSEPLYDVYFWLHSTAAQRAEAFLRTLGLWRD